MSQSIGVAPASIVRASGVFPSHPFAFCPSFTLFVLYLLFSFRSSFSPWKAHVPSRPRVLRTYVHTRSRERPTFHFPPHRASGRRPIGPYPAQKHRTAHDRACNENGGERARSLGRDAGRGETKKSFRIKTGKQKNNQISAYIINEDTCVHACMRARARALVCGGGEERGKRRRERGGEFGAQKKY